MKQLLEFGHSVTCFEMSPRMGGVYTKSYDNTILTTSSLLTAFSDYSDGKENLPKFWTDEEYLDYLDGFAQKFSLYDHVELRTAVKRIYKCLQSGKWIVTVKKGVYYHPHRSTFRLPKHIPEEIRNQSMNELGPRVLEDFYCKAEQDGFENVKLCYSYDYYDHKTGELKRMEPETGKEEYFTYYFDGIAVCTGTNTWPCLPPLNGQENFKGRIIHSDDYKKPDIFKGQRVMVVGAGESGSDICLEIANHADKVAIVVREKHGHLIPRKQAHGRVTDLNTNRCRYSNPYIFGDWIGWVNQHAKRWQAKLSDNEDETEKKILKTISELNISQKTSAFSKFGCKNEGFVTAMVTKASELHRDNFRLVEDGAIFEDGSEFKCDAIVACTGYRNYFPFFEDPETCDMIVDPVSGMTVKQMAKKALTPRALYKQIFMPEFPTGEVAFFGFARPAFGSIPPTVEMQSRYYSLVINNCVSLPDTSCMVQEALQDQKEWEYRFKYDSKRVRGLVDYQVYCDKLAEKMGCLPQLMEIFFKSPKIWFKIMFGPFTTHQYRLQGPFENWELAERVYDKQPVGDILECSITAFFLLLAKFLSVLGFKIFTPNNF